MLLCVWMSPDLIELFCCHFHRRSVTCGADEFWQVMALGCEVDVAGGGGGRADWRGNDPRVEDEWASLI